MVRNKTAPLYPSPVSPYDGEMGVRVYQRKSAAGLESRFFLYYRYDKQTWRVFKDPAGFPFASKNAANAIAIQINAEILQKCHNPYKYQATTGKRWLFKNQINIWLNDKREVNKPSTMASYDSYARLYIIPFFGAMDVSEIKAFHCMEFLKTLPNDMAPICKRVILAILTAFLNHCAKAEIISKTPAVPHVHVPDRGIRWADYDAQNRILARVPEKHKAIIHFAMRHGMRIGEVRGLMVKDIDFQRNTITVQRQLTNYGLSSTKTGKVRVLPLHPELAGALFALCHNQLPDAFVFTFRGKPYVHASLYKVAMTAIKAEGLKITPYELFRHSLLTQAAVRGINPLLIQQYAGHSNMNTTKKYMDMTALNLVSVQSTAPVVDLFSKDKKEVKNS